MNTNKLRASAPLVFIYVAVSVGSAPLGCCRKEDANAAATASASAVAKGTGTSALPPSAASHQPQPGGAAAPSDDAPNAYKLSTLCERTHGGTGVAYEATLRTAPGSRKATLAIDGYQTIRRFNVEIRPHSEGDDEVVDVVFESYGEEDVHYSPDFTMGDLLLQLVHSMPSAAPNLVGQARVVTRWKKLARPCDAASDEKQQFGCDGFVVHDPPACVTVCSTSVEDAACPRGMACTGHGMNAGKLIQYCVVATK